MPTLSQQDDQAEILQAALRLYRQFGPDKVAMEDIAKATGRSRTSIYYYFKNRDEVFRAAFDAIVADVAKEIRKSLTNVQTLEAQVFTFCISKLRISREWKLILDTMWSSMNPGEQSKHTRTFEGLHKKLVYEESLILKEILKTAAERKELRSLSAEETDQWVFVITSGIRGIRNEMPDHKLTQAFKTSIRVFSEMAAQWLKTK